MLYEGGWEIILEENLEIIWKEKYEEWTKTKDNIAKVVWRTYQEKTR